MIDEAPDSPFFSPRSSLTEEVAFYLEDSVCKTHPTPLALIPKASSVPSTSSTELSGLSCFEYEQLLSSPGISASSSRSESPMSDRGLLAGIGDIKFNSLQSLNSVQRLTDSDGVVDETKRKDRTSPAAKQVVKKKRKKKRSKLKKSLSMLMTASAEAPESTTSPKPQLQQHSQLLLKSDSSAVAADSCSPKRNVIKRRTRTQTKPIAKAAALEILSSSSSESMQSNM